MNETSLIERKNNIFSKLKSFFRNMLRKNNVVKETKENIKNNSNKDIFKKSITIKEDTEKIRLLRLQDEFENGNILEEDITEDDVGKLHELYDEQIEEINNETEMYKQKILEIKAKLNKMT